MPGFRQAFLFIILAGLFSCKQNESKRDDTLFFHVPSSHSKIDFKNVLTETDDFNIVEYLYFYNGGGVATGDINNDGLADIYFTANQERNHLYLNKGNFQFQDITEKAGVAGSGNWKTGVVMADVNGDGFLDLFICGVGGYKKFIGENQLFINNGDLTFTDKTESHGLNFQGFSTHSSFFDYDNDGDLDLYLLNHSVHSVRSFGDASLRYQSDPRAGDKLYRNDLIPAGVTKFTEVTSRAGIFNSQVGYGLGIGVSDLNWDGYLDIYISNDFHENDYLYVNQGDGTFKEEIDKSISHSSRFSMGNDIGDINNDGWTDIITLDMLPHEEQIIKTTAGEDTYDVMQMKSRMGYHYQLARNTLQLNQGLNAEGNLMFSDIAALARVEATDWSWAPLLADFDNDGFKDLFIANGIARRPNDLDYTNYISNDSTNHSAEDDDLIRKMPPGIVSNYFYRNQGNLSFLDVSNTWLGNEPSLSNGSAYADFDNDGDLDLVVNNVNEEAFLYRNDLSKSQSHFLNIKLESESANRFGIGTKVLAYEGEIKFYYEQIPSRGWQSSVDYVIHLGLGMTKELDSLTIIWPGNKVQTFKNIKPDQLLVAHEGNAASIWSNDPHHPLFTRSTEIEINFVHRENNFTAFNRERGIPYMLSTQGPKCSVGDINGDGLDDVFIGGAAGQPGGIFVQDKRGDFKRMVQKSLASDSLAEDTGSAFFDADGNGILDLIVASGGQEFSEGSNVLAPRLYINDGKGDFRRSKKGLPEIFLNASSVKPADFDKDGDSDLFIGGHVLSGSYGLDPSSSILTNNGKGLFSDATPGLLPSVSGNSGALGMVTDARWIDINMDGRLDLVLVGEWMPITILIQEPSGSFKDQTMEYGLAKTRGLWNTIEAADFDKDGDIDFVAGNLGSNSRLRANEQEPVNMVIKDIDGNGSLDHILTYFNQGIEYPFISRDQLVKLVPSMKGKFLTYADFANVRIDDIVPPDLPNTIRRSADTFSSLFVENLGNGKFEGHQLPVEAQLFPVFSFCVDDANGDGALDLLAVGNLYDVQPDLGRYDAGYGIFLSGDGKGNFQATKPSDSGFIVSGEGRDIKIVLDSSGQKAYLVTRNNNSVQIFRSTNGNIK